MLRKAYLMGAILLISIVMVSTQVLSETDGSSNPKYEKEFHFEKTIPLGNDWEGLLTVDASIEVYEEPQEGDGSGLDAGYTIEWDEPLYYKGSTKTIWLTYNGYGIYIEKDGPDAGLNSDTSAEFNGRHVKADAEINFDTGVVPV